MKLENKLEYLVACIGAFAERKHLRNAQAYAYLADYGGLAHLDAFYDVEHTFALDDTIEAIDRICARNGGRIGA